VARKPFPNVPADQIRITLIHSASTFCRMGKQFPKLQQHAERTVRANPHIRLLTNAARIRDAEQAILNTGERISTRSIISCTGTTFSAPLDTLPFERDPEGRVVTDRFCQSKRFRLRVGAGIARPAPRRDGTHVPPWAVWGPGPAGRQAGINIKAT